MVRDLVAGKLPVCWVLAVACLVVGGAVAGCGSPISPEQKHAMDEVIKLGGRISFQNNGYKVDFTKTEVHDKDLELLKNIENVKTVDLEGTLISDPALETLKSLGSLEALDVRRTGATREAIEAFKAARPKVEVQHN
jgi:hypothetical protein